MSQKSESLPKSSEKSQAVAPRSSKTRAWILNGLKFGVGFGIIFWMIRSGRLEFSQLPTAFHNFQWLVLAVAIMLLQIGINTYRWSMLLKGVGVRERYKNLLHFSWIGAFFSNVMPGAVGGDLIKAVYVVRHFPEKKAATGMTVFIDRFVGLYSLLLIVCVSLLIAPERLLAMEPVQWMRHTVFLIVGISLVVSPFLFSKRLHALFPKKGMIRELLDALMSYRHAKHYVFTALALSFIGQVGMVFAIYCLSRALTGAEELITFPVMSIVGSLGVITLALPISPAGLGVGQAAFATLFHWVQEDTKAHRLKKQALPKALREVHSRNVSNSFVIQVTHKSGANEARRSRNHNHDEDTCR